MPRLNYTGKDTTQKLETSTETVKTTETIKSTAVDSIMAYSVRHHFWRYPIEPVPAWYKARSKDITDDGKFAYTVTMTEAPKSHKGRIGYNARHEEGNIFSYPTKMDNIPDFTNAKSKVLTEAVKYLLEPGEYKKEVEITMSKEKEKNVTAEYTWQAGFDFQYMLGNYGIGQSGIRVDTDHQWSWGGLRNNVLNSTFTKGDKLSIAFADPSKASKMTGLTNNVAFATTYQAYINPNGLMKMGFAVNLQGGGSPVPMLWRESVYNVSADPSFVLPKKFAIKDSTIAVNPDKLNATTMRGVELYAIYEGRQIILTAPYFVPGQTYTISVPIYNASFVDVPAFTVRLSYAPYKDRNDTSKFTKIGDFTVAGLKGWTQNSEVNKTYANFSFPVPANLTLGDYVFWAEIDPEQKITEVHEEWSEKIPGGNNTGNFIFPIMYQNGENPGNTPKAITSSDIKATVAAGKDPSVNSSSVKAATDDEYFEDYVAPEWVEYESGTALYDYIMSQSDPVELRVNLDYTANTHAGLTVFEIVQEVEEDGEVYDVLYDEETYYVEPDAGNDNYSLYFIVSSEDIKDGKDIRLNITNINHEYDTIPETISLPLVVVHSSSGNNNQPSYEQTNNNTDHGVGSASSGCDVGISLFGLGLALMMLMRKK